MVPFQVPQHVPCVLPPILVSVNGTKSTVESASFVIAKEHPIYLHEYATTIVFAGFLSGHLASQRFLGYSVRENFRQESNGMLFPAVSAAPFCYNPYVVRVGCGRATRLAIDNIVICVRCHHCAR